MRSQETIFKATAQKRQNKITGNAFRPSATVFFLVLQNSWREKPALTNPVCSQPELVYIKRPLGFGETFLISPETAEWDDGERRNVCRPSPFPLRPGGGVAPTDCVVPERVVWRKHEARKGIERN
jgi:hypothetical protein